MMPLREPLYDRDQGWLFPPSLDELVSTDNEVRLVDSAMECLDWSKLESSYSDRGRPAYFEPRPDEGLSLHGRGWHPTTERRD